jgi:S-adenosylmethionine-diacylgycerolhomoserine-N-methlytransferase
VQPAKLDKDLLRAWFAFDNVVLDGDLLPLLKSKFRNEFVLESSGRVPYLPLGRAPYFVFVGRKV